MTMSTHNLRALLLRIEAKNKAVTSAWPYSAGDSGVAAFLVEASLCNNLKQGA